MPNQETIEWWLKTGSVYGLGFVALAVLVGIVLWLLGFGTYHLLGILVAVKKWLPQVVQGHLGFLTETRETNSRIATAVELLTETHTTSHGNHRKTHRALEHIVAAAKEGTTCEDVRGHLDKAVQELRGGP